MEEWVERVGAPCSELLRQVIKEIIISNNYIPQ